MDRGLVLKGWADSMTELSLTKTDHREVTDAFNQASKGYSLSLNFSEDQSAICKNSKFFSFFQIIIGEVLRMIMRK